MRSHIKTKKAFSLVEVVLAIGLFSALVLGMSGGFAFAIQSTQIIAIKNKAIFLADEGLEAARSIKNEAFTNLTVGTFGLTLTGNKWVLSGASDTVGTYTRTVAISSIDSTTKQIISTVSWASPTAGSVSYTMYLSDWLRTIAPTWSSPFLASTLNLTNLAVGNKVAISGNYAFVVRTNVSPNFSVVDISNPAAPTEVFSTTLTGSLTDIFISGNYAYVTSDDDNAEFRIINITTPTAPSVSATLNMSASDNALSVYVLGTKAYVGRASGTRFSILDVTNPLVTPTLVGSINLSQAVNSIYVSGSYAYLATSNNASELSVINVSVPTVPVQSSSYNISVNTTCSAVSGLTSSVLLGCANGILYAVNITNPLIPTLTGSLTIGAAINDISTNSTNTIAFVGSALATGEFESINISNLASMALLGTLNTAATINGLAYDATRESVVCVGTNTAGELTIVKTN